MAIERLSVRGIDLEVLREGTGSPILLLHGLHTVDQEAPFLNLLAARAEIIAPSHPGFGHSPRPADFDTVYDLVHLYLDLLEALPHEKVTLLGFSFGGWLAAEIAAACCHRLARLILVDPLGIKLGDRESRDILDLFNTAPAEVQRQTWYDPAKWALDFNAMSDDAVVVHARNRDALCLYGWQPFMYNPKSPALVVPHRGTDAAAVGCQRWRGHARIWALILQADPRLAIRTDRTGRPSPRDRAARRFRRPRRCVPGSR